MSLIYNFLKISQEDSASFNFAKISRTKLFVTHCNLLEIFNICPEMQWFLSKISHKSHVKFENTKKTKVTNNCFKRYVGQKDASVSKRYVANQKFL